MHGGSRLWRSLVPCVVAVVLVACSAVPSVDLSPRPDEPTDGPFPVTVAHVHGESTIETAPQRVVTLGVGDLALATALGAPVVGSVGASVRGIISGGVSGSSLPPYLDGLVDPGVVTLSGTGSDAEPDVDAVAALAPDLILAVTADLTAEAYDDLAALAPVVAAPESVVGTGMREDALLVGRALGAEPAARELADQADAAVAGFAVERSGLAGRTTLLGTTSGDVLQVVVGADARAARFLAALGPAVPASFVDAATTDRPVPGTAELSYADVDRLDDADLLLMAFAGATAQASFETDPLVTTLAVVREGRYVPLTADQADALLVPTVVNTPWLLEQLAPAVDRVAVPR